MRSYAWFIRKNDKNRHMLQVIGGCKDTDVVITLYYKLKKKENSQEIIS